MIALILTLQFPGLKAVFPISLAGLITTNKLKLNTDKTELFILYSRFRLPPRLPSIKIGIDIINPTRKARNIGVIFNNTATIDVFSYQQ